MTVAVAGAFAATGSLTAVTVTPTFLLSLVAAPLPVATTPPNVSVVEKAIVSEPL